MSRINYFFLKVNGKLGRIAAFLVGNLDCPNSYPYFWPENIWDGYLGNTDSPIFGQSTNQMSTVCNPYFLDRVGYNCTEIADLDYCDDTAYENINFAVKHENGYQTVLNCPECGCDETIKPQKALDLIPFILENSD